MRRLKFLLFILIFAFFVPFFSFADSESQSQLNLEVTSQPNATQENVGQGGGALLIFKIKNPFVSNITVDSANISWLTTKLSACQLFWGETSEYEKGAISETNYVINHLVKLDNLDSFKKYHFKITCVDKGMEKDQAQDEEFETLYILNNVSNFRAVSENQKIILSWKNPPDKNFDGVKILRSNTFYPLNINDGAIVYEGYSNYFEDLNVYSGKTYFYTIFTVDKNKNYSSGAIVSKGVGKESAEPPIIDKEPKDNAGSQDLNFSLNGLNLKNGNTKPMEFPSGSSLNILTDCREISNVKSAIIKLKGEKKDSSENISSFILEIKQDSNSCDSSFLALEKPGKYTLEILVLDSKNKIIQKISTEIVILSNSQNVPAESSIVIIAIISIMTFFMFWFLFNNKKTAPTRF